MMKKRAAEYLEELIVPAGKKISLARDYATDDKRKLVSKESSEQLLQEGLEHLATMQDKLYAHDQYSVLIVLQAMDAAGKDGIIKHVISGLNPVGVKVSSFKAPTSHELDHDYFWRHYLALPARGEIGIFNRSHYENVLVTRVHPELVLRENLPGVESLDDLTEAFWRRRYDQINRFEKNLAENGTVIIKIFLHLSRDEQKKRFLDRIDDPAKNWKLSPADAKERLFWDDYQRAYEEMLPATSCETAPWFVVPADDKWFARLCIAAIITQQFERLNLDYPSVSGEQLAVLEQIKKDLLAE
jgi:PPK2 family polyphosphate:nucleotide phosphotransferase